MGFIKVNIKAILAMIFFFGIVEYGAIKSFSLVSKGSLLLALFLVSFLPIVFIITLITMKYQYNQNNK